MSPLIAAAAVFVAVVSAVLAIVSGGSNRAVERRLRDLTARTDQVEIANVLRSDSGTFPVLRRLASGGWFENAAIELQQAGSSLKASEYLLLRMLAAACVALLMALLFSGSSLVVLAVVAGAGAGFMAPSWALQFFKARRVARINAQLPEALSLISSSLRSGFAFTQAVELATKQVDQPIQGELSRFLRDVALGAPTDVALEELAARAASYDLEMMVATILVQRTTGGNLSEILDNVAETIRERERVAGEIRALTASQRLTGLILSVYPLFLAVVFYALAPDLMSVLWEEELGRALLLIAVTLQVIGIVTIRRILRPEV